VEIENIKQQRGRKFAGAGVHSIVCCTDSDNGDESGEKAALAESPRNVTSSASLCGITQTAFKPVTPRR